MGRKEEREKKREKRRREGRKRERERDREEGGGRNFNFSKILVMKEKLITKRCCKRGYYKVDSSDLDGMFCYDKNCCSVCDDAYTRRAYEMTGAVSTIAQVADRRPALAGFGVDAGAAVVALAGRENAAPVSEHLPAVFPSATIFVISSAVLSQMAVNISVMLEHFGSCTPLLVAQTVALPQP